MFEFFKKIDFKKILLYNFWLKLASLAIAALVWFYIISSITAGGRST